jgi:hypothetical protein
MPIFNSKDFSGMGDEIPATTSEGKAVFHLTPQHHDVMILIKLWRYNYDHIIETFNHIFRPIATSGFTNKSPGDIEINVGNNQ